MRLLKCVLLLFVTIVIQGCASKPKVDTRYRGDFNFSTIDSYSLYDRNSSFSDFQNISDSTRNSIEIAIEKALDAQGYVYSEPAQADIIVAYHIVSIPRELKRYNAGVRYSKYRLQAQNKTNQSNSKGISSPPGSIILDLVETNKQRSIWRGVSPLAVKEKDNAREVQQKIHLAISQLLGELPNRNCTGACL